jgi:hypothetical protein
LNPPVTRSQIRSELRTPRNRRTQTRCAPSDTRTGRPASSSSVQLSGSFQRTVSKPSEFVVTSRLATIRASSQGWCPHHIRPCSSRAGNGLREGRPAYATSSATFDVAIAYSHSTWLFTRSVPHWRGNTAAISSATAAESDVYFHVTSHADCVRATDDVELR